MKLTNIEVLQATNTLDGLDLSFPIRSAVRVNRAQKVLEKAAQKVQERRQEINEEHRATNEDGDQLFMVVLPDGQEEMTQEEIQDHDELDQSTPIQPKFENQDERQEELEELMQKESDVDTEELDTILSSELDAIEDAFQSDRVSSVMETITQATELTYDERQQIEQGLENELADGVSLSDTKAFSFLFPSEGDE